MKEDCLVRATQRLELCEGFQLGFYPVGLTLKTTAYILSELQGCSIKFRLLSSHNCISSYNTFISSPLVPSPSPLFCSLLFSPLPLTPLSLSYPFSLSLSISSLSYPSHESLKNPNQLHKMLKSKKSQAEVQNPFSIYWSVDIASVGSETMTSSTGTTPLCHSVTEIKTSY